MKVLAINSGSSSVKCKVIEVDGRSSGTGRSDAIVLYEGAIEEIGPAARLWLSHMGERTEQQPGTIKNHEDAVQALWRMLEQAGRAEGPEWQIDAVGHRVVHGGEEFREPVFIDEAVMAGIDRLAQLAPLHNPGCLAGIRGARAAMGLQIPMVAVFDTAFHHSLPPRAATYAIDLDLARKHRIRRYGFHGIAHASMAGIAAAAFHRPLSQLRLITLQLGNGCSAAAIDRGRSVDTSMGFTPLEGLVMGTRSGDIDPALVAYLSNTEGMTADEVEQLLNERSGLLGLSGLSRDMRELLSAAEGKPDSRAALAIEVFCYRVRKYIGAYLAVLGGADAVVFGGGIGERAPAIRERICQRMEWCGLLLDPTANRAAMDVPPGEARAIGDPRASLACLVAGVDEEVAIARATRDCLCGMRSLPSPNGPS